MQTASDILIPAATRITWDCPTAGKRGVYIARCMIGHGLELVDARLGTTDTEPRTRKPRAEPAAAPVLGPLSDPYKVLPLPTVAAVPGSLSDEALHALAGDSILLPFITDAETAGPAAELAQYGQTIEVGADVDSPEGRAEDAALVTSVDPEPAPEPAPVRTGRFAAVGKRGQLRADPAITLEAARERLSQLRAAAYPAANLIALWSAKVAELEGGA